MCPFYQNPGVTGAVAIPDASSTQDGVMSAVQATKLALVGSPAPIVIYVSTSGNDSNPGTAAAPFLTPEKAFDYASSERDSYHIVFAGGNYTLSKTIYYRARPTGPSASAVCMIGAMADQLGTRTVSTGGSKTVITDSSIANIRNGSAASIVAGAAAGQVRVTGVAGYLSTDVGSQFAITTAASRGNNGSFQIAAVNSPTSIDIINAQAVVGDANNGAIAWLDSFKGAFLEFLTGANAGSRREIRSNTATAFTINLPFDSNDAVSDTFSIEKPAVNFNFSSTVVIDSGSLGIAQGIKFTSVGGAGLTFRTLQVQIEGMEVDLSTGGSFTITNMSAAVVGQSAQATAQWGNDANSPFSSLRNGSGAFIHNGTFTTLAQSRVNGYLVLASMAVNCSLQSHLVLLSLAAERVTGTWSTCSVAQHTGATGFAGQWKGQLSTLATGALVTVQSGSVLSAWTGIDMFDSGGDAIQVLSSTATVNAVTSTGTPANVGVGIAVDQHAYVKIDSTTANATSVTGTLGNTKFGHPTINDIETYATIRTADGAGVKGYQDSYGNRIEA